MPCPPRTFTLTQEGPTSRPPRNGPPSHAVPSPIPIHHVANSLPHLLIRTQKRDPFVSLSYTRFAIHSFAHPFCFVITAHSLPKTPGVAPGFPSQILAQKRSFSQKSCSRVTQIESKRSTKIAPNPSRMKTFHDTPRGWGSAVSLPPYFFTSALAHVVPPWNLSLSNMYPPTPSESLTFAKLVGVGPTFFHYFATSSLSYRFLPVCPPPINMLGSPLQKSHGSAVAAPVALTFSPFSLPATRTARSVRLGGIKLPVPGRHFVQPKTRLRQKRSTDRCSAPPTSKP
jgi:hypothetical protein